MAKPTAQQCHAMTTYFISKYSEVRGKAPVVNRNACRYRWEGMLMDYTTPQAKELIDFYIDRYEKPDVTWFLFNYEKLDVEYQERIEQQAVLVQRRKETEQRLREWEDRWKKQQQK